MADRTHALDPDQVSRVIMLAFGAMEQGGQYWCYVAVKPSRYEECKRLLSSRQYNIQHFVDDGFGEIIVSGAGGLPPREVVKQVALLYDIPIRQMFDQVEPLVAITNKIEAFINNTGEA